jgi:hypothetical protein
MHAYTAHLFARALCERFPEAKRVGGQISEIGFYYSFVCPQSMSQEALVLIEEKMRGFAKAPPSFRLQEMVPKSAAALFADLEQPYLQKACLASSESLVKVVCLGEFRDLAIGEPKFSSPLYFALLDLKREGEIYTVFGTAFASKEALKAFVKKYKAKKDWREVGSRKRFLVAAQGLPLWLPKGVELRDKFYQFFLTTVPQGAREVKTPLAWPGTIKESHTLLYQRDRVEVLWEWRENGDVVHAFIQESQVEGFLKSSLQWIDKTCRMLGFESEWHGTQVRLYDSLGRSFEGPKLEVDKKTLGTEKTVIVDRTLFSDLEGLMLKWIEKGEF